MKSALPGVLLVVAGALLTYWSLTKLGLLVGTPPITPTGTGVSPSGTGGIGGPRP